MWNIRFPTYVEVDDTYTIIDLFREFITLGTLPPDGIFITFDFPSFISRVTYEASLSVETPTPEGSTEIFFFWFKKNNS